MRDIDLVDSVNLCGGFCVWLSRNIKDLKWLNGRFLDARWDANELLERKDDIVEKDLLKWALKTSSSKMHIFGDENSGHSPRMSLKG